MLDPPVERDLIIDASAVLALLFDEPGGFKVEELLTAAGNRCWIHVVNLCEVYYDLLRRRVELSTTLELTLRSGGFKIATFDAVPWRKAGQLKAGLRRISLADCFAVALALQLGGEVVTCDRHELEPIHEAGICRCLFLR